MEDNPEALKLIITLMEQNSRDTAWTTNALLESYMEEARRAKAEVLAIRHQIRKLLAGPYQPSNDAIIWALYPTPPEVDSFIQ